MIEAQDLRFSYGNEPFIEIDGLKLENGCLTAILGLNGSGKTTLLKLLSGIEKPKEGRVFADGDDLSLMTSTEIARRIAYFPQNRPIPDMTALDAVLLGRYPHSRRVTEEDKRIAEHSLGLMGASELSDRRMKQLSCGERQRVYLATTLSQSTDNCLFDEPSNFLDMQTVFFMMKTLTEMKLTKCVVCVFHDVQNAFQYADRIMIVKNGRIFDDGSPQAVYENKSVEAALGVGLRRWDNRGDITYAVRPL